MIMIIFDIAHPTAILGMPNLKRKMIKINLEAFKKNVKEMLDDAKITCNDVLIKGGDHDYFMLNFLDTMETRSSAQFLKLVEIKRSEWEDQTLSMSESQLIVFATKKHNKIFSKGQSSWNKSDDKNAKDSSLDSF